MFLPRVHLFALPVVHYDVLATEPIAFSAEDAAALAAPPPEGPDVNSRNLLTDLETSEGIQTLASRLEGVVTRPRDTLILYVSAHGVASGETAELLTSDYLRGGESGRYAVADLLAQVSQCPGKLKLVILDTGRLASDPPQGLLVNAFPRLLEDDVARLDDPALWVLVSNSPMELAHVSPGLGRSVFGLQVAEALRGAADADGDRAVELDELADFVRRGVSGWAGIQSGGREPQTPVLLHAGEGRDEAPAGLAVVPVVPSDEKNDSAESDDAPEADGAETESGAGEGEEPAGTDGEQKPPAGETGEPEPSGEKSAPAGPAFVETELGGLLFQAWQLRDALIHRTGPADWTPVDYAPHLARELDALLVGYERRARAGTAFDPRDLTAEIRSDVLPLEDLVNGAPLRAGVDPASVVARLAAARDRFRQRGVAQTYDPADPQRAAVAGAIHAKNDAVFAAPYYVRWHARGSFYASSRLGLYRPILTTLSDGLPDLIDALEPFEDPASAAAPGGAAWAAELETVGRKQEALQRLRREIEEDGLHREARELVRQAEADSSQGGLAGPIVALLETPLLPAELRRDLLASLDGLTPPTTELALDYDGPSGQAGASAWQRAAERAWLEVGLVHVADRQAANVLGEHLKLAEDTLQTRAEGWEDRLWAAFGSLGIELGEVYRKLPGRVAEGCGSSEAGLIRTAERALRLVDARDAALVPAEAVSIAVRPLPQATVPAMRLVIAPDSRSPRRLDPQEWTEVGLTVTMFGAAAPGAEMTLDYDPAWLAIEPGQGASSAEPGKARPLPLADGQPRRLSFRLKPAPGAEVTREESFAFSLRVRAAGEDQSCDLPVTIVPPNVVDLEVEGVSRTTVERPGSSSEPLRLRPFPNRKTGYRFSLVNRSGQAKEVTVQLLSVPEVSPYTMPTRADLLDRLGDPLPGVKELCPPMTIELPAEATPVAIPLPDSKATEPPAESTETPATDRPAAPPPPDVSHGLAWRIRDTSGNEWLRWVRIVPRAPKDYLDPIVRYDALQRKILIDVQPRDTDSDGDGQPDTDILPPHGPKDPIRIVWETGGEGELPRGTTMVDQAVLAPPRDRAGLFAQVESAPGKEVIVRLTVDGYPRAFEYHVGCVDNPRDREELERSLREVRILSPEADQPFRVLGAEPVSVPVRLEADAPEDAFQQPSDFVEVGIDVERDRDLSNNRTIRFFADRQVSVLLDSVGPGGRVVLDTRVGDFDFDLPAGGLKNVTVDLIARLRLDKKIAPREPRPASVPIVLDGAAPKVVRLKAPVRQVPQGQPLHLEATVDDGEEGSGVVQVEFGFALEETGDFEPGKKPKLLKPPPPGEPWATALPTDDREPGRYMVMAKATDRVGLTGKKLVEVTIGAMSSEDGGSTAGPGGGTGRKKTSTIQGRVVFKSQPVPNIEVTVQGANLTAKTDAGGNFTFQDVPHGSYKLVVDGIGLNRFLDGQAEVTLPPPKEPAQVTIHVE